MRFITAAIISTLCIVILGADDPPAIKSVAARAAIEKRDTLARRAEQDYRTKLVAADKQLVTALDQAIREAMSNKDLTEATALNDMKKRAAQHLAAEQAGSLGPTISGTRWNWMGVGGSFITFKADGTALGSSWGNAPGHWIALDDTTIDLILPSKMEQHVTFTSDLKESLWVEISPGHSIYFATRAADAP
jgi:hypothetical protein